MSGKKKPHRSLGGKLRKAGGARRPLVPKWKLFRAKEPLLSVFMWGVNHSIGELMHVPPPGLLMPYDFKAFNKIKVDNHNFNKDNMPSHFKVKEYCPNVFRNIREQFGVDQTEFLRSLTYAEPEPDPDQTDSTGGSRFFTSYDKKFVFKTMDSEAVAEVHSLLRDYHEFVVQQRGKTLLPQYLALFRLTVDGSETYVVVMRNIFGTRYGVHMKYDLKGSTVSRAASEKERGKELPTLKDNDFLDSNTKLYLPEDARQQLMDMLRRDTDFLTRLHLMDYSLLLGIHDVDKAAADAERAAADEDPSLAAGPATSEGEAASGDELAPGPTPPDSPVPSTGAFTVESGGGGPDLSEQFYAIASSPESERRLIYFIGLVDILTYYGVKKRTESAANSVKYGSDAEHVSTVKPDQYAKRFLDFVQRALAT